MPPQAAGLAAYMGRGEQFAAHHFPVFGIDFHGS
jgi:hypothetical protein